MNEAEFQPTPRESRATARPLIDERRTAMRFTKEPGTDYASIVRPESVGGSCQITDESLGGLGLVLDDVTGLEIGGRMEVVYAGTLLVGQIRHITPRSDGRFHIGFGELPG